LYIAFWAAQAAKRDVSDTMSYGWVRSEILGGLTNGCFLLSLCLYVVLEAIPRFIDPPELDAGWPFIAVAGAGLAVNTIGTLAFAATGISHGHSHGGGGDHGHSHGGHGGHGGHGKKKKKKGHGHSHGGHDEHEEHEEHAHGDELDSLIHKSEKKKSDHGHSHGGHGKKKKGGFRIKLDLNMWGVFIHYLGDMISSAVVLVTGILLHFVGGDWTLYVDPVASLLIVALIMWTTIPLVKECSMILLQSTPSSVALDTIRDELYELQGVESVHDLHVWQLAEGKVVASVHISVEEGMDFIPCLKEVKGVFHQHGIHSITVQPEFVPKDHPVLEFCEENCVQDCEEDWCCKKTADRVLKESGVPRSSSRLSVPEKEHEVNPSGHDVFDPFNVHTDNNGLGKSAGDIEKGHSHGHKKSKDHSHSHAHSHGKKGHSHGNGHDHEDHDHDDSHDDSHDDDEISVKL